MRVCFCRTKNQALLLYAQKRAINRRSAAAALANYLMQGEMDLIKVKKRKSAPGLSRCARAARYQLFCAQRLLLGCMVLTSSLAAAEHLALKIFLIVSGSTSPLFPSVFSFAVTSSQTSEHRACALYTINYPDDFCVPTLLHGLLFGKNGTDPLSSQRNERFRSLAMSCSYVALNVQKTLNQEPKLYIFTEILALWKSMKHHFD
jgi:hypothetical protein